MQPEHVEIDFDEDECGSDDVPYSLLNLLKGQSNVQSRIFVKHGSTKVDVTDNLKRIQEYSSDNHTGTAVEIRKDDNLNRWIEWSKGIEDSGGRTTPDYAWKQNAKEVHLWIPISSSTLGKNVRIGIKGGMTAAYQFDLPLDGEHAKNLESVSQEAQMDRNITPIIGQEFIVLEYDSNRDGIDPCAIAVKEFHEDSIVIQGELYGSVRGEPALRHWEVLRNHIWVEGSNQDLLYIEFKKAVAAPNYTLDLSTPEINEYSLICWWGNAFKHAVRTGGLIVDLTAGQVDVEEIKERKLRRGNDAPGSMLNSAIDVFSVANATRDNDIGK